MAFGGAPGTPISTVTNPGVSGISSNMAPGACPPGKHREGTGGQSRCVPDPPSAKPAGGAQAAGTGATFTPGTVPRPTPQPVVPTAEKDPNLEAYRSRYEGYQKNLEAGAGHSMDVLTGAQADQLEAQVQQAREAAARNGIPFDEAAFRAEGSRGIYAAQAQEKLGREKMIGESYTSGLPIETAPATERDVRLATSAQAQEATNAANAQQYGLDISKYGIDVNASTAANQALMNFYSQLMGGLFNSLSGNVAMSNYYGG